MVSPDGCFSARSQTWCPPFPPVCRGKCCGKACGSFVLRRGTNAFPLGTASRRRKERRRQRSRFLPAMAKTSVRHARTPHRGDAHNARLTPPRGSLYDHSSCPPFCIRGDIRAKITRARKVVPFYTSSRTNVRELPGCCSPFLAGGFLASLTSPLWGSCAASSECSCKQAFLLASGGMTEEWGHAPTSPRWGSCAASSKCSCKQAFLLASGGMTKNNPC